MELVTIEGVPILRVGTFSLMSGPRTFAEEDLVAAANALATDAGVKAPRVKLEGLDNLFDPAAHGGPPAAGWVDNLRVVNDGQELLGDFHVPDWVAASMEWAYPSLSIEGTPPGWESATGRTHELVITAVQMLGVDWPGVTTLDDLRAVLADGPEVAEVAEEAVLAAMPQRPTRVMAGLDQDLVARRFYDCIDKAEIDLPAGVNAYDLWIRSMRFDDSGTPYLKVTDEGSGDLYRVDFTIGGSDVSFGEFVEVVEQDVPVAAGAATPAAPLASWNSREESRAVANHPEEGLVPLDLTALRTRLGLAEDADEEAINAALAAPEDKPDDKPEGVVEDKPADDKPAPGAPTVPDGMVVVDAEQFASVRQGAEEGAAVAARVRREDRDRAITAAIGEGRFSPSRREHYERMYDRDPDGTLTLLTAAADKGGLAPGLVPVDREVGSAGDGEGADTADEGTGWFQFDKTGA